ncbi:hypothetical protein Ahy_B01g055687 [Arachis hypogaea]|uniref:Aminotransferase-like plant mobile domain-containing protein n=1 Tax=Arachis hypogaea TaxID=3818 RepID=A0A445AWT4_ARAHY|nr:hypothetical protein Ahy_B01g055687 [Arachis hypogaea]
MRDNPDRLYRLDGVAHIAGVVNEEELLGVLPPADCIDKFTVRCSWMQETFGEIPDGADDATIQRYARAYIMMLLGTQLFGDKSGTRLHIRWLPFVARLEDIGGTVGDQLHCHGYTGGPVTTRPRARGDLGTPEVVQVLHPEILEPRHMALWRSVTSLIYFAIIEWHQVDRVLPQFGGVQPLPWSALNIDFLMAKDGRDGDRPSHEFLDWWAQHGRRFLSPELFLGDPRAVPIPAEVLQRGPGRVSDMDRVDNVPDRRRVERRARVGTRWSGREWQWLDQAMEAGEGRGRVCARRGRGGRRRPTGRGRGGQDDDDGSDHGGGDGRGDHVSTDGGGAGGMLGGVGGHEHDSRGSGPLGGDYDDQPVHESQTWVSPGRLLSDMLTSDGLDAEFGGSYLWRRLVLSCKRTRQHVKDIPPPDPVTPRRRSECSSFWHAA